MSSAVPHVIMSSFSLSICIGSLSTAELITRFLQNVSESLNSLLPLTFLIKSYTSSLPPISFVLYPMIDFSIFLMWEQRHMVNTLLPVKELPPVASFQSLLGFHRLQLLSEPSCKHPLFPKWSDLKAVSSKLHVQSFTCYVFFFWKTSFHNSSLVFLLNFTFAMTSSCWLLLYGIILYLEHHIHFEYEREREKRVCVCVCVFVCAYKCTCWGFPTRMVYLYYISCLRYTILVGNPRVKACWICLWCGFICWV